MKIDIPITGTNNMIDSSNKRFVTDANLITIGNQSGVNSGNQTITLTGGVTGSGTGSFAATVVTNANLTGDITSVGNATTLTNAPVIAKVLTGYVSGAGVVAATDSILQAIQKLNGNNATITLTTTGTSGAATLIGSTLNVPQYSGGGGGGITRSVISITVSTTLGATALIDYVYFCTGTINATLPTAVGNTNRYTIINSGTGVITVVGTISGATNDILYSQYETSEYQSNGTNWFKIN